jgi:condensin complex subunit 3
MEGKLATILDECQKSFHAHKKGISMMQQLRQADEAGFRELFLGHLDRILLVFKREVAVERLVQLIVNFATQNSTESGAEAGFEVFLLDYLVNKAGAKNKAVRFRVCQLVANLMKNLDDEAEISDQLWEDIVDKMLTRANDKIAAVRVQAVHALNRLQDPEEEDDPVTEMYLRLLHSDTCKEVRKAVLMNVGISRATVVEMIERSRDTDKEVRKELYNVIGQKLKVKQLKISQRMTLLANGLNDREEVVKQACTNMLCDSWLQGLEYDCTKLLQMFDCETNEKTAETALRCIFEKATNQTVVYGDDDANATGLVNAASQKWSADEDSAFTSERVLYWRVQCSYFSDKHKESNSMDFEDKLEAALPDTAVFCALVSKVMADNDNKFFVLKQMLQLSYFLDFQDEVGRQSMLMLQNKLLSSMETPDSLVNVAVKVLKAIHSTEDEHIRFLAEIISDIQDPLDESAPEVEEVPDTGENDAGEEGEGGAEVGEAAPVAKPAVELTEEEAAEKEEEELFRVHRCLLIISCLLRDTRKDLGNPALQGLLATIVPAISSDYDGIREAGVRCLGYYCLLDEGAALNHNKLLLHFVSNDQESTKIKSAAIKALFDLCMMFPSLLTSDDGGCLVSILTKCMDYKPGRGQGQGRIACTCAEGFAKLLFVRRIRNSGVLLKLFQLYFTPPDPEEEEDDESEEEEEEESEEAKESLSEMVSRMQQCLSVFFPAFAMASTVNQHLVDEVLVTVVGSSPDTVPNAQLAHFVQYLLYLLTERDQEEDKKDATNTSDVKEEPIEGEDTESGLGLDTWSFHQRAGLRVLVRLSEAPTNCAAARAKELCKTLQFLQLSGATPVVAAALSYVLERVAGVKDRTAVNQLKKCGEVLEEVSPALNTDGTTYLEALNDVQVQELESNLEKGPSNHGSKAKSKTKKPTKSDTEKVKSKSKGKKKLLSKNRRNSLSDDESEEDDENENNSNNMEAEDAPKTKKSSSRRTKSSANDRMKHAAIEELAREMETAGGDEE